MRIRDNEGKACDAVVKLLEMRTGETHADIRHPEKDRVGPPLELRLKLGVQEYAIEHTRIEPFENQIKASVVFKEINDCIKRRLSDTLPESAYYEIHVPIDVCLPEKKGKRSQALNNLVEWIRTNAQCLHERNSGRSEPARNPYRFDACIQGTPAGIDCAIELLRWPDAALLRRNPGDLGTKLVCPEALENLCTDRLRQAFSDKCPKLKRCKAEGARTVLVLESRDIALTRFDLIGGQLPVLLAERTDGPDEIYLVETHTNPSWVWLIKRDDDHWPTVGMPRSNQVIYEPDKLPTAGMPKWYRDALQLDQLYAAHLPGWTPATFEEDELEDLTLGRGSKKL